LVSVVLLEQVPHDSLLGLATRALVEARRLAGPGQALFAQTAPGDAAALRALLAAGFRPIGSEVLFFDDEPSRAGSGRGE